MASYFITGASRGIGLGLCAALAAKSASEVAVVYAAARTRTDALKELVQSSAGRVKVVDLDVTSEDSIKNAARQVEDSLPTKGLDVLINNAGVQPVTPEGILAMAADQLESCFKTNVTGPHLITSAFIPLLEKGASKKVINISSTVGSITNAATFAFVPFVPAYKVSKAALNQLTKQYAFALADKDFTVVALSPGWVQTRLGGDIADMDVATSVKATLEIVLNVKKEDNGKFFDIDLPGHVNYHGVPLYQGGEYPW